MNLNWDKLQSSIIELTVAALLVIWGIYCVIAFIHYLFPNVILPALN